MDKPWFKSTTNWFSLGCIAFDAANAAIQIIPVTAGVASAVSVGAMICRNFGPAIVSMVTKK